MFPVRRNCIYLLDPLPSESNAYNITTGIYLLLHSCRHQERILATIHPTSSHDQAKSMLVRELTTNPTRESTPLSENVERMCRSMREQQQLCRTCWVLQNQVMMCLSISSFVESGTTHMTNIKCVPLCVTMSIEV